MAHSIVVSGSETVAVLLKLGFVARRGMRVTILERGRETVAVPDVALIAPEMLGVILREASLSYEEFVACLQALPVPIAQESGVGQCAGENPVRGRVRRGE